MIAGRAYGQSAFLDSAQIGAGTDIRFGADLTGGMSLSSRTAYSLNGIVDLGIEVGAAFDSIIAPNELQIEGAIVWNVTLLKQDRVMPVSVLLTGAFDASMYSGEKLTKANERKTGAGYRVGMDLFRYFRLVPRWYMRLGAMLDYGSERFVTELIDGTTNEEYPFDTNSSVLSYGGIVGVSYRPNKPNRGIAVSFDLRVLLDTASTAGFFSVLSFTIVEQRE